MGVHDRGLGASQTIADEKDIWCAADRTEACGIATSARRTGPRTSSTTAESCVGRVRGRGRCCGRSSAPGHGRRSGVAGSRGTVAHGSVAAAQDLLAQAQARGYVGRIYKLVPRPATFALLDGFCWGGGTAMETLSFGVAGRMIRSGEVNRRAIHRTSRVTPGNWLTGICCWRFGHPLTRRPGLCP